MALSGRVLLISLLSTLSAVCAEDARISSLPDAPGWLLDSLMHLQLTAPETEALASTYTVYPLTEHAGLNQTDRSAIWIRGSLVAVGVPFESEPATSSDLIAFLSCDGENATRAVNRLMAEEPKAILLYSTAGNCCSLQGEDLSYNSIYTMGDSWEARDTVNTTIRAGGVLRATITGSDANTTSSPSGTQEQSGSNSAVAMSILYSITGLITLLFLVIISTGAIRAHRYPERYGPRSGYGGRPSQSRARGLARAVLETLPIVKFGDPSPAKPDPSIELESQPSAAAADPTLGTRLSAIPEEPRTPQARQSDAAPMSGAVPGPQGVPAVANADAPGGPVAGKGDSNEHGRPSEEHLGCSICTDDFTVGEDVRLLPCNHKFHPACIDPWLINVSGTCPLCRLDLRAQHEQSGSAEHHNDPFLLAPPLAAAENWTDHDHNAAAHAHTAGTSQRRRSSRFLDLHRLRHASIEERIEILRRHRTHRQQQEQQQQQQQQQEQGQSVLSPAPPAAAPPTDELDEQRGHRAARLTERLRERFRIRTRTQGTAPPSPSPLPSPTPILAAEGEGGVAPADSNPDANSGGDQLTTTSSTR